MAIATVPSTSPCEQQAPHVHPATRALLDHLCGDGPLPEAEFRRILDDPQLTLALDETACGYIEGEWADTRLRDLLLDHDWMVERFGPTYAQLCWRVVRDGEGLGDPYGEAARFSAAFEEHWRDEIEGLGRRCHIKRGASDIRAVGLWARP